MKTYVSNLFWLIMISESNRNHCCCTAMQESTWPDTAPGQFLSSLYSHFEWFYQRTNLLQNCRSSSLCCSRGRNCYQASCRKHPCCSPWNLQDFHTGMSLSVKVAGICTRRGNTIWHVYYHVNSRTTDRKMFCKLLRTSFSDPTQVYTFDPKCWSPKASIVPDGPLHGGLDSICQQAHMLRQKPASFNVRTLWKIGRPGNDNQSG